MDKKFRSVFFLGLTSIIWGLAFVFQSTGMDHVGPYTYNFGRGLLAGISLLILILVRPKSMKEDHEVDKKLTIKGGIVIGLCLAVGQNLQQLGIVYTDVGKAGFLTTLYIVFIPILYLFFGKKPDRKVFICVLLAAVGLYFISIKEGFVIEKGDILLILGAIGYAVHLMVIAHYSPKTDNVMLSCIQFFVYSIISLIIALFTEDVTLSGMWDARISLLYTGVLSSAVGYTISIVALKDFDATIGSLILSLESIVAAIAGAAVLHQFLTPRETFGCAIVFLATVLAQVDTSKIKSFLIRRREKEQAIDKAI
ncbi:DMT family transporter [Peptoniphilus sp.]|uniref:DMT family transporter n=1 Tax=Peptoniphilus sp. TaxID=1971214 RepID=UPI003991188D